jgi:regulator of sigma E protease
MNTIIGMVLALGVIILVHEWGHFIIARLFGVRVDVFSIGFGPRLFGFKRGATDWRVSAVPLGGYVRMAGQDMSEVDSGDDRPTGAPDEVMSKPRWQRALISAAGPAVNLIFPIFLLTAFYLISGEPHPAYNDQPAVILAMPANSMSPLHVGDKIISVDGTPTANWEALQVNTDKVYRGSPAKVTVENSGVIRVVEIPATTNLTSHIFGYHPIPAKVSQTLPGKPAARGGMKDGDIITAVDGRKISYWEEFVDVIHGSDGKTLKVDVSRNGQTVPLEITPTVTTAENGEKIYQIGIAPDIAVAYKRVGPVTAVSFALAQTKELVSETLGVIGKLFSGRVSVKELQSVVGISRAAGEAVSLGAFAIVNFMALISVNLGILNLLPIPILDGGHILMLTLEGIRRRDFSLTFKERFIQVGLVFLLALFAYVMYNDVVRLLPTHS